MEMKSELRVKKQFPFVYVHRRPKTNLEIIVDDAYDVWSLLYVALPLLVVCKIIQWVKK